MRELGLAARRRRRRRWSSYAGEASPAPPNLPLRPDGSHDFSAARPNELWVTDITEFRVPSGGKRYLSPAIDCFDGRPVAWSIGPRPTAALADSSLEAACATPAPSEAPAVHSDRGGHHRWPGWIAICEANGLPRSMSRKGTSGDNARAEGFFDLLKQGFFYAADWTGASLGGFMGGAGRLDALVPLGPHIPGARLAHARRAPARARLCGVGTRNRPQSPMAPSDRTAWPNFLTILLPIQSVWLPVLVLESNNCHFSG